MVFHVEVDISNIAPTLYTAPLSDIENCEKHSVRVYGVGVCRQPCGGHGEASITAAVHRHKHIIILDGMHM